MRVTKEHFNSNGLGSVSVWYICFKSSDQAEISPNVLHLILLSHFHTQPVVTLGEAGRHLACNPVESYTQP